MSTETPNARDARSIEDEAHAEGLERALAAAVGETRGVHAAVALYRARRVARAVNDAPVRVGCVAKILTAALARRAVSDGRLELDADVPQIAGPAARALRGVTVRRLLEHTHGLDDSLLDAPRWIGRADLAELCGRVARLPRLAPPGALYSYGNVGAWLVAALLERVSGASYGQLVRGLLAPLGCAVEPATRVCPATGGELALTASELARFACEEVAAIASSPGVAAPHRIVALPGWNPLECGVYLGWKHAGAGWLGHQSTWPGASVFLRAHPAERRAIVVVSRTHPAAVLAHRLFGRELPGLFRLRPPSEAEGRPLAEWVGRYERAALAVDVRATTDGLALVVRPRGTVMRRALAVTLQPSGAVCLAVHACEAFPFAQLVGDGAWLWNGRVVFRRAG